jgi:hypothetical protein
MLDKLLTKVDRCPQVQSRLEGVMPLRKECLSGRTFRHESPITRHSRVVVALRKEWSSPVTFGHVWSSFRRYCRLNTGSSMLDLNDLGAGVGVDLRKWWPSARTVGRWVLSPVFVFD